ncbi:MAG TPA: sigma-70 family RNA polymerase sigma factor [Mycobacteriales bacterium]|nr:sigma-70 family RNA polymerase sigma factor [Mycobacteriales bacterium]
MGDRLDFAEFYRDAVDDCLRAVVVSVADADVARDLVDEAFARAWASWSTVGHHPAPKAWIVRTALNAGVSRWRRRRREIPVPAPVAGAEPSQAGATSAGWVDPQIMTALRRLPERQRQVVALRLILDLDTNTTAATLGIAPGTVMAHLARAMTTLRSQLEPDLRQEQRS